MLARLCNIKTSGVCQKRKVNKGPTGLWREAAPEMANADVFGWSDGGNVALGLGGIAAAVGETALTSARSSVSRGAGRMLIALVQHARPIAERAGDIAPPDRK